MRHVCEVLTTGRPGQFISRCGKTIRGTTPEMTQSRIRGHQAFHDRGGSQPSSVGRAKRRERLDRRDILWLLEKNYDPAPVVDDSVSYIEPDMDGFPGGSVKEEFRGIPAAAQPPKASLWARIKSALRLN